MKKLFKTLYSVEAISELKNMKLRKSLLLLVVYTLFINFGLALSIVRMKTIDPTYLSQEIYQQITENEIDEFPNCQVMDSQLICDSTDIFIQEFSNFNLVISPHIEIYRNVNKAEILFLKNRILIRSSRGTYNLDYHKFQDVDFNRYKEIESNEVVKDISNRLFLSVKPLILFPLLSTVYLILISFNTFFILGLAGLGLILNIGNKRCLKYKQTLNVVILSSLTPAVISFIVSLTISPIFSVVIYNFSLALFFLYVNKNVIKGNFS